MIHLKLKQCARHGIIHLREPFNFQLSKLNEIGIEIPNIMAVVDLVYRSIKSDNNNNKFIHSHISKTFRRYKCET